MRTKKFGLELYMFARLGKHLRAFGIRVLNQHCDSFYHSARLNWNSIERRRGPLEDNLIEDVVEWSLWHYPIIRQYVDYGMNYVLGTELAQEMDRPSWTYSAL